MKRFFIFFSQGTGAFLGLLIFFSPFLFTSCAAVAKSESPVRGGAGLYLTPGVQVGKAKFSAHTVLGYERVWFKNNFSHQDVFMIGGQGRYYLSDHPEGKGWWAGGEAAYMLMKNKYDNTSVRPSASGFVMSAMGGYRFSVATVPVSIYVAPGFFRRGKFSHNYGSSSGGFHGRVGFDVHFMSLLMSKGR